jgi:hypothetical protein
MHPDDREQVSMTTSIKGIVHGKVIELEQEPGLPDGQEVSVTLQPITPRRRQVLKEARRDLPKWEGQVLGKLTREEIYDERL